MRRYLKYPIFFFAFLFLLGFTLTSQARFWQGETTPKNIILFIGDGMGVGHITAAKTVKGTLNLEQFKTVGLLTTHTQDKFLTSSSASTTALVTGFQTNKGYISISPLKTPLKTVLEYAEEREKSTGLVVTSSITDATPACFVAHTDSRKKENAIAEDIVRSGVDVFFGGGLRFFLPASHPESARKDEKDLIAQLQRRHQVVTAAKEFRELGTPGGVFGFFGMLHLPPVEEREISLTEMTQKAIDILSTNENGFFLMVEGSQIDWAAHHGDSEWIIRETIDLDDAIGAGLRFAEKDGNTLLIVTADHETGGYCIIDGSVEKRTIRVATCATTGHTADMVPLFTYGPGSEVFGGIHKNTFVGKIMIKYIKEWRPDPKR